MGALWDRVRAWARTPTLRQPRIGLALGGGFARGLAHIGVIKVLEENGIPIHAVAGTSAGAVVGGALAGGATCGCLIRNARGMRFSDLAGWKISRLGFASNERMAQFLARALPETRFDHLKIPLAVTATDLLSGDPVIFRRGDLIQAVRASCAYPGLFLPVQMDGRTLVDGAFSCPVPVEPLRQMGMTHVIAVHMGTLNAHKVPENLFQVVNQCFVLMQKHVAADWRGQADVVIEPEVEDFEWDDFGALDRIIAAGEAAARAMLPALRQLTSPLPAGPFPVAALPAKPGRIPLPGRSVA